MTGDVFAHESWFTDERPPFDWSFALDAWFLIVGAVAVTWAVRWVGRKWRRPELAGLSVLGKLAPWVPRILGIHAGVSLLAQASTGTFLAPSLALPPTPYGTLLAVVEGVVGVWLITGYRIRPAALLLVASGPIGMIAYGALPILERVDLLGVATFLAVLPPADDPGGAVEAPSGTVARALFWLRLMVGGSLVVLAFTEKLARPQLAVAFLNRYPAFNVLESLGLGDAGFIRLAGTVELLFGLLIISGAIPQVVVILAGLPFNATLFFLGSEELIGHLPLYGAMLALLVYGSHADYAPLVSVLKNPLTGTKTRH